MEGYEAPAITELGSVADFTRANLFGETSDNLTWIIPILGDRSS